MKRSTKFTIIAFACVVIPFAMCAQTPPTNHKPVLVHYSPNFSTISQPNVPYAFLVGASDPDGDTLIYTWRLDAVIVQAGRDSTYTLVYPDPSKRPHNLHCIFSDPGGLKDSIMWTFDYLAVPRDPGSPPLDYALNQNYPNPFNPSTTISYQIPRASIIKIRIFNLRGQQIATLVDGIKDAGFYQIGWNAEAPSGVYFYCLEAGSYVKWQRMLLIK
jgi:hypothetical protein